MAELFPLSLAQIRLALSRYRRKLPEVQLLKTKLVDEVMDGRIAVKLQDDKSGLAGTWYDRIQNSFYHASQPISMKNSCKKNYSGKEVGRKDGNKDENIFTGR